MLVVPVIFFFFSSRRRHTRFDCDWSSDVCSSDLLDRADALVAAAIKRLAEVFAHERSTLEQQWSRGDDVSTEDLRSEERRVGKECRLRGLVIDLKKIIYTHNRMNMIKDITITNRT